MLKHAAAGILGALIVTGCEKPVDPTKTKSAIAWLEAYYGKRFPTADRWAVTKIETTGSALDINIRMPERQAQMIMRMPPENQFKLISTIACPDWMEPIWSIVDRNHRIVLHVSGSGGIFIDVDCRSWVWKR
jgi:hypothetical protein